MEQPVYYWDPVIAPSGAMFYTGDAFPDWNGDLFVGSLQPGRLVRLGSPTAASCARSATWASWASASATCDRDRTASSTC